MTKKRRHKPDIVIDETAHQEVPSFGQRIKHLLVSVIMGILFAQVILFMFRLGSFVIWLENIFFILYLGFCAAMGWVVGDKFVETLVKKIDDWWDIRSLFRF